MKLSARNILKGVVVNIVKGAVNSEVIIELPGGAQIVSVITNSSVETLG
jgi:molybdopterin-binding protein